MELSKGRCTLCEEVRRVFIKNTESFTKQIQNAFFAKNKDEYSLETSAGLALCIICCQKLQFSFDFKKSYDQMCNRNHKPHKNKCFFCESRTGDLVAIDNTKRDFGTTFKVFMKTSLVRHNYNGLSACISCMYSLNVWSEVRTRIYSLVNLPVSVPTSETKVDNNNMHSTPTMKRSIRKNAVASKNDARSKRNMRRLSTLKEKDKERKWKMYLNERLKHIRTAAEIIKTDDLTFADVDESFSDKLKDKLFTKKAYVSMSINSQISSNVLQGSDAYETILINDSDDEGISSPTTSHMQSTPSSNSKNTSATTNKPAFKIKFSSSFSKSLTLRNKFTYTCVVCDKGFFVRCDYLAHLLRHENVESLIINVTRYNLPARIKVQEFESLYGKKTKKLSLPVESINQLLVKWVGEHAADTFDESDKENDQTVNKDEEETEIAEVIEEGGGHEEGNLITEGEPLKDDADPSNSTSMMDTSDHPDELVKDTAETGELIDGNCLEIVDGPVLEEAKENSNETTACGNETKEIDGRENSEAIIASSEDNTDVQTESKNDEDENQNELNQTVETESNKDESCVNEQVSVSENEQTEDVVVVEDVQEEIVVNSTDENTNTPEISENAADSGKYEEFSSDESNTAPDNKIVSCEELLSILEDDDCNAKKEAVEKANDEKPNGESLTENGSSIENVSGDEVDDNSSTKRKRVEDESDETTPKRKRVRFASEKAIMTPDNSILLEKVSEGDDVLVAND